MSLVLAGTAATRLLLSPEEVSGASLLAYEATLCMLAGGLLAGLLVAPWQQAAVADLVVELGEARSGTVRGQLSQALGDPSLAIGYGCPTGRCSSTPTATCSPSPMPVRVGR
ncbi:MAG TPA: hypothetical protein VF486_03870 [Actinomycetes bacterium]